MLDLKITGGSVIDGTGFPPYSADVGIKGDRIVSVGECGAAAQTLDAAGAIVTPGFVDLHTHYDGQVTWDSDLAPSCNHGVTTVVMGNCGVGFAPVRPTDHQQLVELMEGVEDIPGTALHEGLSWNWESFGEYMDAIDARPHVPDILAQVTHDPLRMYVMGERAVCGEAATDDDIAQMKALIREAMLAGAAGFSVGRSDNHKTAKGAYTPSSEADMRELAGLAQALKGLDHGVLQAVSDFDMNRSYKRFEPEFDLLEAMVDASGKPMSLSLLQRDHDPSQWEKVLARVEKANSAGKQMRVQVAPRPIGVLLGFEATFQPFMGFPTYKKLAHLPLPQRVAEMRKAEVRAQILSETSDKVAVDGTPIPKLADDFLQALPLLCFRLFRLGAEPDYEPKEEDSIGKEAIDRGEQSLAVLYDALLEQDGKALLYFPLYNYTQCNLDNVHRMLTHPFALPGLSDGGAHVGTICDASFPTFMLSYWGRDRPTGRIPLERLVQMQTADTAKWIGLTDRGLIRPGMRADLNVIDFDALKLAPPRIHADLPAGGHRLLQEANGYVATLVKGQIVARDGALTGARPGRMVRMGQ